MRLTRRAYRDEDDYWQVRSFLRELYLLNGRREQSWQVYRWDYWRWHVYANTQQYALNETVFLWHTPGGELAAVLNPEGAREANLQVHPDYRTVELETEMVEAAEKQLAGVPGTGQRRLLVWCHEGDGLREGILERRGFRRGAAREHQRRRPLGDPVPDVPVARGYTVRALGDAAELPARSYLSWQAFHPDEPDEKYEGWEWYRNVQRAPLYRRDLDIVALAAEGEFAAFCTVWFDDVTRTASFEPVGTAPKHQRRGLGKAVMTLGLQRAQRLGATLATVSSFGEAAHGLYHAAGFTEYDIVIPWVKEW